MLVTTWPPARCRGITRAVAARWMPGTAVMARTADGLITEAAMPGCHGPAARTTSAPVSCQDAAVSARTTAPLTMPVNAATVIARTIVIAGSARVMVA